MKNAVCNEMRDQNIVLQDFAWFMLCFWYLVGVGPIKPYPLKHPVISNCKSNYFYLFNSGIAVEGSCEYVE